VPFDLDDLSAKVGHQAGAMGPARLVAVKSSNPDAL